MHRPCGIRLYSYSLIGVVNAVYFSNLSEGMDAQMLARIYTGHMGVEKCKHRACNLLLWLRMGQQIETLVGQCNICQERHNANIQEPLMPHVMPQLSSPNSKQPLRATAYQSV